MNKEKNKQPTEPKKNYTSVLESIRKRTGLLVGIVGLALVIFILESLLGSGASIFGNDEITTIGKINGKRVDRMEFANRYEAQLNNYRQRNRGQDVDDNLRSQAAESVWNQYVIDMVMIPAFESVGITVGDDELYDCVMMNPVPAVIQALTDPNTGQLNEQLARPDGSLDPIKWKAAVQQVTGDQEMFVKQLEEQVKTSRYFEKFRSLVNKGLYITKAELAAGLQAEHHQMEISYVMKRYDEVSDSTVKLTDSDIEKYYKANAFRYIQDQDARSLEFVTFNVMPTPADIAAIEKDAHRAADEFRKSKTMAEDSMLMAQESEDGNIVMQDFTKKTMIVSDSSIFTAAPGTVFGPYNEGAYFKIYKLEAVNSIADSARVRHILVGLKDPQTQQDKRNWEMAKKEADSVAVLLKERKANFDSLVINYSDDPGSKNNGGDYGWLNENSGFVEPFKNAGLTGAKGNISVVQTQYGYHIIEVLDVSKTRHTSYKVGQIFKLIAPSEETYQEIFAKANKFGGENNTAELFDKAVQKEKLTKRKADNVREGDYQIAGISGAKDLVKWAYSANKGEVNIFSFADKHVVVKLAGIQNKGVLPLEEVKEDATNRAMREKKGDLILNEFVTKAANAKTIDEVASKMTLRQMTQNNLIFAHAQVDGIGLDQSIAGTAFGSKQGALSKPVKSENGVYVLTVKSKTPSPSLPDENAFRKEKENMLGGRTDYAVFEALKEVSDIEFHKSRID